MENEKTEYQKDPELEKTKTNLDEEDIKEFTLIFKYTTKSEEVINEEFEDEWGAFTRYANQRKRF